MLNKEKKIHVEAFMPSKCIKTLSGNETIQVSLQNDLSKRRCILCGLRLS